MNKTARLAIIQYNVQKQHTVMWTLLRDPLITNYDIIAVQEPWIAKNGRTHNPNGFYAVYMYEPKDKADRPKVCFLVNTQKIRRETIRVTSRGPTVCTLHIKVDIDGAEKEISIHNVYNPCTQSRKTRYTEGRWEGISEDSALPHLDLALDKFSANEQVVVGDFNLEHLDWFGDKPCFPKERKQTTFLREMMEEYGLTLALEPGTITRPPQDTRSTRGTCIDLVWATPVIQDRIFKCLVSQKLDHASDHKPVGTIIGFKPQKPLEVLKHNMKRMDEVRYNEILQREIPRIEPILETNEIDSTARAIVAAVTTAVEGSCPLQRIHPQRSKPNFTEETIDAIKEVKRAQRRRDRNPTKENFVAFQVAKRDRDNLIKVANTETHREKVSEVTDERGLWGLARWARSRDIPQAAYTPDIKRKDGTMAEDLQGKTAALREILFPKPPDADLSDIDGYQYMNPKGQWVQVIPWEVSEVIRSLALFKAAGADELPNKAIMAGREILVPILTHLFNASLQLQHCPEHFKKSITVALRKPGKPDYSEPKAYRPIALMNTIGKVMDAVLARRISHLAEKYAMLPFTHAGGRKLASCEHGIHTILERIHSTWREKKIASLLLLDVSGAFDNVSHTRLLHNLRKRGLHPQLVGWIQSYLQDRTSAIKLREGTGPEFKVGTGIPQGSPLSPILYLFYNADLLEINGVAVQKSKKRDTSLKSGYIDDLAITADGKTTAVTVRKLKRIAAKCEDWARKHASVFAVDKWELLHFAHKRDKKKAGDLTLPLELPQPNGGTITITPKAKARYLGVILDPDLNWSEHIKHIEEKTIKSIAALQAISGSTWGVTRADMLKLYKSIVVPRILFASSVWYIPQDYPGEKTRRQQMLAKLGAIQKKALCVVTGAFKTTALSVLEAETAMPSIESQLLRSATTAAVRILGSPMYRHMIRSTKIRTAVDDHPNTIRLSPLQRLERVLSDLLGVPQLGVLEVFNSTIVDPWWQPPPIHIAPDAKMAVKAHDNIRKDFRARDLWIYTDGSDIDGHVGSAAWCEQRNWQLKAYMGTSEESTVYAAELMGIKQALEMAVKAGRWVSRVFVFTDNQASIQSMQRPKHQSGQYILQHNITLLDALRKSGVTVELHWIPAHIGVPGNERVDQLAKEAAGFKGSPRGESLAMIPKLKASCKRILKRVCYDRWTQSWATNTTTGASYRRQFGSLLDKHINNLYAGMPKALSSLLIQMRVGKIGLNSYLHKIKRAKRPWCECKEGNQTVAHILEECPLYRRQRRSIFNRPVLRDVKLILSYPQTAAKAANFMLSTGLLDQFRHYRNKMKELTI